MRIITFISALLFACVLTAFGVFGYWSYTTSQLEDNLPAHLENVFPGDIKYERMVRYLDPTSLNVTLKGVTWSYLDVENDLTAVAKLGDIDISGDMFGATKLSVKLPKSTLIALTHKGDTQRYRLSVSSGVMDFDIDAEKPEIFASSNVVLLQKEVRGKFKPALQTGYMYFNRALSSPVKWSTSINELSYFTEEKNTIDSVAVTWQVLETDSVRLLNDLLLMGMGKNFEKDILSGWKAPTIVNINDGRISYDGKWYAVKGSLGLSAKGFESVDTIISTNRFNSMLDGVRNVVGPLPLALDRMMRRVVKNQGASQGLNFVVRSGKLYINGSPAGMLPNVSSVFEGFARAAEEVDM